MFPSLDMQSPFWGHSHISLNLREMSELQLSLHSAHLQIITGVTTKANRLTFPPNVELVGLYLFLSYFSPDAISLNLISSWVQSLWSKMKSGKLSWYSFEVVTSIYWKILKSSEKQNVRPGTVLFSVICHKLEHYWTQIWEKRTRKRNA